MPALIPADVQMGPSMMKMRSSSTLTLGNLRCNSRACCQWVVARRSSSRPVSARMNAPVQIEAVRRHAVNALRMNLSRPLLDEAAGSRIPVTISVSNAGLEKARVSIDVPMELATGPPPSESTRMS